MSINITMNGVTEYNEGMEVSLSETDGKLVIKALNEAGYNSTEVDLLQLLEWVKTNRPDLIKSAVI